MVTANFLHIMLLFQGFSFCSRTVSLNLYATHVVSEGIGSVFGKDTFRGCAYSDDVGLVVEHKLQGAVHYLA
jgi:hypothetical protein